MTDSILVTDQTTPDRVSTHMVVSGKWVIKASQPHDLGHGIEPLTPRQAEVISRRIAILLMRQKLGLETEWL
jgi:hypothetical protein